MRIVLELRSYLGGRDLGVIPVVAGTWALSDAAGVTVPGTIEFAVPATPEWLPVLPHHPLAGFGQRVRALVGWEGSALSTWGWYRLDRPVRSGSLIRCTGRGLLREVERARLTQTWQTTAGDTRAGVARALLAGLLPVAVTGVTDEALPVATWTDDRLGAFWEVVESWPARVAMAEQTVQILPPWDDAAPGSAVGGLIDGPGGTLLGLLEPAGNTNTDPYNGYVVSSLSEGDQPPMVGFWAQPDGPMAWGGPYGQNPAFFASPLNPSDEGKLRAIAERMTRREAASSASWTFQARPDPARRVGDVVTVRSSRQGIAGVGRIMSLTLTRSALTGEVVLL